MTTLPTIAEITAIAPAPWVQEGDTLVARWGERPAETVLTVRRGATFDLLLVEATLGCFAGSAAADYPDEIPRVLRTAYTNAVLGVQAGGAGDAVAILADGNGALTAALDMSEDMTVHGMGTRSNRYSATVEDGVVTRLNAEENSGVFEVSSAEALLEQVRA